MKTIEPKDHPEREKPFYISSYDFYRLARELEGELDRIPDDAYGDDERWDTIVEYFSQIEQATANAIKS